jgi:hypothetical protein
MNSGKQNVVKMWRGPSDGAPVPLLPEAFKCEGTDNTKL